eukprot:TRINITY_DN628_c0_g1_i11.p1 TRINITY_DN628_c0_g1~~TRINITY_DN628_c0_g1_i11.p1  ORF type:complete len:223 (+),score=-19.49 TRINITY_DN628_c0_g1_i11:1042-1710(+)
MFEYFANLQISRLLIYMLRNQIFWQYQTETSSLNLRKSRNDANGVKITDINQAPQQFLYLSKLIKITQKFAFNSALKSIAYLCAKKRLHTLLEKVQQLINKTICKIQTSLFKTQNFKFLHSLYESKLFNINYPQVYNSIGYCLNQCYNIHSIGQQIIDRINILQSYQYTNLMYYQIKRNQTLLMKQFNILKLHKIFERSTQTDIEINLATYTRCYQYHCGYE